MKRKKLKKLIICAAIFVFGTVIDQITKYLAIQFLKPQPGKVTVIDGILDLVYCENTGAAFSIMSNATDFLSVCTALCIVLIAVIIIIERPRFSHPAQYMLAVIATGGMGNLIDRIFRGYVVDMIDLRILKIPHVKFSPFSLSWGDFAIFNVADCFVTVGMLVFIVYLIFGKEAIKWSNSKTSHSHRHSDHHSKTETNSETDPEAK